MTDLLYDDRAVVAQHAAITVLTNRPLRSGWADDDAAPALPLARGLKLYIEGIDAAVVAEHGEVVQTPEEADAAILRLHVPFGGSLEYSAEVIDHVERIAGTVPTVVDVVADRQVILERVIESAVAVTFSEDASAAALLDVLTGAAEPEGRLAFDLPRSVTAVEASGALFELGHGLSL